MTKEWELNKDRIRQLYLQEDLTLKEVMRIMEDKYIFFASSRTYRTQFQLWGWYKYEKNRDKHETRVDEGQGMETSRHHGNRHEIGGQSTNGEHGSFPGSSSYTLETPAPTTQNPVPAPMPAPPSSAPSHQRHHHPHRTANTYTGSTRQSSCNLYDMPSNSLSTPTTDSQTAGRYQEGYLQPRRSHPREGNHRSGHERWEAMNSVDEPSVASNMSMSQMQYNYDEGYTQSVDNNSDNYAESSYTQRADGNNESYTRRHNNNNESYHPYGVGRGSNSSSSNSNMSRSRPRPPPQPPRVIPRQPQLPLRGVQQPARPLQQQPASLQPQSSSASSIPSQVTNDYYPTSSLTASVYPEPPSTWPEHDATVTYANPNAEIEINYTTNTSSTIEVAGGIRYCAVCGMGVDNCYCGSEGY